MKHLLLIPICMTLAFAADPPKPIAVDQKLEIYKAMNKANAARAGLAAWEKQMEEQRKKALEEIARQEAAVEKLLRPLLVEGFELTEDLDYKPATDSGKK